MKSLSWKIGLGFFLLGLYIPNATALDTPEFSFKLSSSKVQASDSITLQINAKWPKGDKNYSFLMPSIATENLTLLRNGESQETMIQEGREWIQKTFELEFQATRAGRGIIRAFALNYLIQNTENESGVVPPSASFEVPEQKIEILQAPTSKIRLLILMSIPCLLCLIFIAAHAKIASIKKNNLLAAQEQTQEDPAILKILSLGTDLSRTSEKDIVFLISSEFRDFLIRYFQLSSHAYSEKELVDALMEKQIHDRELFLILERLTNMKYSGGGGSNALDSVRRLREDVVQFIRGKKVMEVKHSSLKS